jgi:hypothetical protein
VCRNFLRGYCKFGASCHHIHSKEPQSGSAVLTPPHTRMRTARSASTAGCSPPLGHAAAPIAPCGASAELNSLGSIWVCVRSIVRRQPTQAMCRTRAKSRLCSKWFGV